MAIYRGAGGAGDATADAASEASLIKTLAVEVQADADAAEAAKVAAQAAQAAAEVAETNAETAETNAETAETNAETAASSASSSASAAATSATNAANSATAAQTAETNAETAETNAAASASAASTSATNAASSASSASASASTATTQATNAANSASAAATSATNASNSASAAATSATNASNSATAASGSATSAASSASTATTQAGIATTQATNAAASASAASTSETNAASSASSASTSATNASNSASSAATSATNASNSATASASSASDAAASAAAAAASYDNFDDRYLGSKSSAPTLDNDGNALLTGALYYNNGTVTPADKGMYVYDGSQWIAASAASTAILTVYKYTATAGQTTFSGNDDNAVSLVYTAGSVIITLNGVVLEIPSEVTASSGTSVVLSTGAVAGDELNIYAFATFNVANTYTQAQVDAGFVATTGNQTVAGVKTFSSLGVFAKGSSNGVTIGDVSTNSNSVLRLQGTSAGRNFQIANNLNVGGLEFTPSTTDGGTTYSTPAMVITSAGNVGIGTSSPARRLDVRGALGMQVNEDGAGTKVISMRSDFAGAGPAINVTTNDPLLFLTNNTERMRIDSSGNVGIGTSSPGVKLDVAGAIRSFVSGGTPIVYLSNGTTQHSIQNTSGAFTFFNDGTERMRIDSSGYVGINTSSPSAFNSYLTSVSTANNKFAGVFYGNAASNDGQAALQVAKSSATNTSSQIFVEFFINAFNTASGRIAANGASAAAFVSYSDRNLKENIVALPSQLGNILALKPSEFDYKDGAGHQIGFIAQEFKEVYPDCVTADNKGILSIVGWSKTEARLVKAIQEQQAIITDLRTELDSLKSEVTALKGQA